MKKPIKEYMTKMPHTIGEDMTVAKDSELMKEYSCHHLPVLSGGKLVGIVSKRDLLLASGLSTDQNSSV